MFSIRRYPVVSFSQNRSDAAAAAAVDAVAAATAKEETKQTHTHTHKKKSDKGWKEDVLLGPVKDRIVVGRSGKHRRERMRRQGSACTG